MVNTRGEQPVPSAYAAGSLIGIILLIFVFYVILIPPAERAKILGDDPADLTNGIPGATGATGAILLQEQVGRLGVVQARQVTHNLPNVNLFETRDAQSLASFNPFRIESGLFTSDPKTVTFALDPDDVENVLLSLKVPTREGDLKLTLNGLDLFEGPVLSEQAPVLTIDNDMLQETNTLVFDVVGSTFSKGEIVVESAEIIGDVVDSSSQQGTNTFVLADEELNNLERAELSFFVECLQRDTGVLDVMLNGKRVFSAIPVCDSLNKIDLFQNDFSAQRNTLSFSLTRGGAIVESMRIITRLTPTKNYVSYFNLDDASFTAVDGGSLDAVLHLSFVDDHVRKEAEINVNGRRFRLDQSESTFEKDISDFIVEGNNYVQLSPVTELNIVELTVAQE